MRKYRLHVDETVNRINYVDIETSLNVREIDALLTKVENDEITSAASLKRKLESQGIKVKGVNLCSKPYYLEAKTLEIEELEEPKKQGIMIKCKACDLNIEDIEQAIEVAREAMIISIEQNGMKAAKTINLSQELDILIVAEMKKATKDTDQSSPR